MGRKTVIALVVAFLIVVAASAWALVRWYAPMAETKARSASDRAAAIAAVVAAEPKSAPRDFTADFWNPVSASTAEVDVYRSADAMWDMKVLVEWDASSRTSRALSMKRDFSPK
jgi:hypothetical protein